jgi:hypothetical protein
MFQEQKPTSELQSGSSRREEPAQHTFVSSNESVEEIQPPLETVADTRIRKESSGNAKIDRVMPIQVAFERLQRDPLNRLLQKRLDDLYCGEQQYDEAIKGWWTLLRQNPFRINFLRRLHEVWFRKYKTVSDSPRETSLVRFAWLCLLKFLSEKAAEHDIGEIDWWPLATEDDLTLLQPYMVKRAWKCVLSHTPCH